MYIKRILTVIIAVILLATAVSCSSGNVSQISGVNSYALKSGNSKELTMYIMDYDTTAKKAIDKFNETRKDVQIKAKSLVSIPADNLSSKLMYELNSGNGPDIILCEQGTLPNLSVFFGKGSFYDLNILINNDKSFKKTDFFEKVFEYGVYKEKRFVIPLSFKIDSLYTTKEILDKSGQGISSKGAGIEDFVEGSAKYITANTTSSSSTVNDEYYVSDISFSSLVQTSAKPFFNLANKTAEFNSKAFGDLMDKYKSLSVSTCPDIMVASPAANNSLLSSDKAVFASIQTMGPRYAAEPYGSFKSEVEPIIMSAPYADTTQHVIAKPEKYIGINSRCSNFEAAYDFIKLMLSKNFQDIDIMEGIPVNRKVYEQEKDNCLKALDGYNTWKKGGCKNAGALKVLYSQLDELIDNIDRCWTTDDYLLSIVEDEVDNYLKSNSKKENTLKTIQEKVDGYLKSGIMTASLNKEDNTPTDPSKTVSLYYWSMPCYVDNSEYVFKQKYPDLTLKKKIFKSLSEFYKSTAVELMAGGGPDIVVFQPRYFNSMSKVVRTGVFCEMDEYIKKYDILSKDCNENLLKAGLYNGKRYYIPLKYLYNTFVTSDKLLEKNNIKIEDGKWTWVKFAAYATQYMKNNEGKNRYFLKAGFEFSDMLISCEIPLIDYSKSHFDSSDFKELLKLYKQIYPSIYPQQEGNLIRDGRIVFDFFTIGNALVANYVNEDFESYNIGKMVLVNLPTITGIKKNYVLQDDCIAVNSKCKNKDIAFKYVKIAASYEMQRDHDNRGKSNCSFELPLNDKAYKDDLLSYPLAKAVPDLVENLIKIRDSLEDCNIKEYNIRQMANEIAKDYINGSKTLDQAAKEMDEKVNVYLNE